jgi:hypothetical protein
MLYCCTVTAPPLNPLHPQQLLQLQLLLPQPLLQLLQRQEVSLHPRC